MFWFTFTTLLHALMCLLASGTALPLAEFYSFGPTTKDARLRKNDDSSSGRVPISVPFSYFDKNFDSLFVNTNGGVSFVVEISQFTPAPFPLGRNRRLLAPFWADVDIRNGGDVWYREEKANQSLLNRATNDVRAAFLGQQKFTASWLFIATWDKAAFFGARGAYKNRTNTFQAVLITNGRHSFVIYNYHKIEWTTGTASGGSSSGLGGKPAQCGFNAGDGVRFSTIPGSRTAKVLNLPKTSNVGKPGVWIFRIDSAEVVSGGCNTAGFLTLSPTVGPMLGGTNIIMAGPCYDRTDNIVCEFADKWRSPGVYLNDIRAVCTAPLANITGRVKIKVSRDGGRTFPYRGIFTLISMARAKVQVLRFSPEKWVGGHEVKVIWNPVHLDDKSDGEKGGPDVMVRLARYTMNRNEVQFHSFYTAVQNQKNTGESVFSVPVNEGDGNSENRFVSLVQVIKTPQYANQTGSRHQWIYSDVFVWQTIDRASIRCKNWYNSEPGPELIIDDSTYLHCPRNLLQAMADRGRYMDDEHCNLRNTKGCRLLHRGAKTCYRSITPSNKGAGTQCCYNSQGNLMFGPPGGGSLDRVHTDAGFPYISHYFHDIVPYWDCCILAADEGRCWDYYLKRPSDNGQDYEPPRPAAGFGDPHMVTLDGVEYTFNGFGEFFVLRVPGFTLQGRMQPLVTNNRPTKATVYTAFAMRENGSDTVQIQLNGRGMVDVLVNKEMQKLADEGQAMEFRNVWIIKYANVSKYSAIFHSGISVTIQGYPDLLQLMVLVPQTFKGHTSGLLGLWDGNKVKEFLLPNGSFIDTGSSAAKIHTEFGMKWLTTAGESLFTYERGKSYSSYVNTLYTPLFFERDQNLTFSNPTLEREARAACGGNIQCLYDISVTGKKSIGIASKEAVKEFKALVDATESKACVPLKSKFPGGSLQRTDTNDSIAYKFSCSKEFKLNGAAQIQCTAGSWTDSKPQCVKKAALPTYAIALIGVVCGLLVVIIVVVVYVKCKKLQKMDTQSNYELANENAQ